MEPWRDRKRPWEDDELFDANFKRRGSTSTAFVPATRQQSPPPPPAGYYSGGIQILSQRRLPPLQTPFCSTSAASGISQTLPPTSPKEDAGPSHESRSSSQTLFNAFQHPHWQLARETTERPASISRRLDTDDSPPPSVVGVHRPRFGTGPAPPAAGADSCCPFACEGRKCSDTRSLTQKVAADLSVLDAKVRSIIQTDHHSLHPLPEFTSHLSIPETLRWALDLVQWTNRNLQTHIERRSSLSPELAPHFDHSSSMRRAQHHIEEREEQSPPHRQYATTPHGYPNFPQQHGPTQDDNRRTPYGNEPTPLANSPHQTASSSGSIFMPPQSPMQAPQPLRTSILPSPSSLNFPNPNLSTHPPMSPPVTTGHNAAQSAHLQDLQHQISVKTLAFQTLQREYDSLLQKLERQRTKCTTLEKKFEVSDVEINSLLDEKEKLQGQVAMLETQVEEVQQNRDEARRQLVANGAQYMRIMEMANKLQAQGAEDKKKWDQERTELERRIRVLEEAMVTGPEQSVPETEQRDGTPGPPSIILAHNTAPTSQTETINVLRAEVARLRSRTQSLETALQKMRQESISIQAAAQNLVESSNRLDHVARSV